MPPDHADRLYSNCDSRAVLAGWQDLGSHRGGTGSARDNVVRLQDPVTGAAKATLYGHRGQVPSGAFSPDETLVATASSGSTIIVWHVETGKEVMRFDGQETRLRTIAFASDGRCLAVAGQDGMVRLWHLPSRTVHSSVILSLAFSPTDSRLVLGDDLGKIFVMDARSGGELTTWQAHKHGVYRMTISKDGRYVATADYPARVIKVWNFDLGSLRYEASHDKSELVGVKSEQSVDPLKYG